MTTNSKTSEFWAVYTAYFGKLNEPEGAGEWSAFINQCDLPTLLAVVRDAGDADRPKGKPKPRVGDLRRLYRNRTRSYAPEYDSLQPRERCARCDGTGYAEVVDVGPSAGAARMLQVGQFPNALDGVWLSSIPCLCSKGKRINAKHEAGGAYYWPPDRLQMVHDNCVWAEGGVPQEIRGHRQEAKTNE